MRKGPIFISIVAVSILTGLCVNCACRHFKVGDYLSGYLTASAYLLSYNFMLIPFNKWK